MAARRTPWGVLPKEPDAAARQDNLSVSRSRGKKALPAGRPRDGEKVLVFVTDKSRAVYVPTRLGYAVVVSPGDPQRFLAALRRAATEAEAGPPAGAPPRSGMPAT